MVTENVEVLTKVRGITATVWLSTGFSVALWKSWYAYATIGVSGSSKLSQQALHQYNHEFNFALGGRPVLYHRHHHHYYYVTLVL